MAGYGYLCIFMDNKLGLNKSDNFWMDEVKGLKSEAN